MEETKSVAQMKVENKALWQSLTKRNEQYMLGLDRTLRAANLEDATQGGNLQQNDAGIVGRPKNR